MVSSIDIQHKQLFLYRVKCSKVLLYKDDNFIEF